MINEFSFIFPDGPIDYEKTDPTVSLSCRFIPTEKIIAIETLFNQIVELVKTSDTLTTQPAETAAKPAETKPEPEPDEPAPTSETKKRGRPKKADTKPAEEEIQKAAEAPAPVVVDNPDVLVDVEMPTDEPEPTKEEPKVKGMEVEMPTESPVTEVPENSEYPPCFMETFGKPHAATGFTSCDQCEKTRAATCKLVSPET